MRRLFVFWLLGVLLRSNSLNAAESTVILENFDTYTKRSVPEKGWRTRSGDPKGVYEVDVEANGNLFLKAKDHGQSVQFFKEKTWKIRDYPFVSWRWRVRIFPEGSDERVKEKNDSAAALYFLFPRFMIPESIKYVWSEMVPEKTWIVHGERYPMLVVRSGKNKKNEWVTEKRNLLEDYQKEFGHSPPNPVAIGFLTDANAVKLSAEADYDDILATNVP